MDTTLHRLGELTSALDRETRLVGELREALVRQRAGVAADDRALVDLTVDDVGRILLALEEARRGRAALLDDLTGDPAFPLARLDQALDAPLPPALADARAALREAAQRAAGEVAINHAVLRHAVEAGEAFLQRLFASAAEPPAVYGAGERDDTPPGTPGALVDRSA